MQPETIILIISNIVVPIVVALITGIAQAKKYKKEIQLIKLTHESRIKEITQEYEHKIEMLELQHKHNQELESQRLGHSVVEKLTGKLSDEIIKQPATQKMINQKTTRSFLNKKHRQLSDTLEEKENGRK